MFKRSEKERSWIPFAADGIEFCGLRKNDKNGGAGLVRLRRGARFPRHSHPGWEETLVLSGVIVIDGNRLVEGDYLFTEAGEVHDAIAEEDTIFFVSSERGIEIVEDN